MSGNGGPWQQRTDGRWVSAEPLPEPFGVVWGRLWHARRSEGEPKWRALCRSWLDTRAINRLSDD